MVEIRTLARIQPIISLMLMAFLGMTQSGYSQTNLCKAILARKSVKLSGDMLVDSFNSFDPLHSTNGRYDPSKREDGADIASVSDTVTVITDTGNTRVYGHFATGPAGSVTISGNASVGSIAWVDGGNRGIQPGWYTTNFQATISDAALPNVSFSNLTKRSGTVNGTNYAYVLTAGNYKSASSFTLNNSTMCINGNVVLYFPSGFQMSGQAFIYIAPNARLTVYLGGASSISGRGAINGTGNATNCAFYGLPGCTGLENSGSSDFIGILYAPEAVVKLTGGGSSIVNFAGSIVADTVTISGNYQFHFDQALCGGCSKPTIVTPPANQTACPGDAVTFNVAANGIAPTYKWSKNGSFLTGRTNSSLTLTNVSAADAATYSVIVSSPCGSVTNSATLTVRTPVSVAPLPNLVRFAGGIAVFTAVVSGTGPFAYVWSKDGTILSGQTDNSLVLTNLTITNSGTYTVTVTGPCDVAIATGNLAVDTCFSSVDVMLVIDRSSSMTGQPYNDARLACSNFVPNLHFTNNGDKCGLASYNSTATLDQKLTNSLLVLDQAIKAIPAPTGFTSISLGLQTAQSELVSTRHNTNALPVIILLSDGLPTAETKSNTLYNATQVKYAGTRIFTVGFGSVDPSLLASIASSPSDFYYGTNSSQLSSLFTAIATIICRPPTNIVAIGPSNQTVCAGAPVTFSVVASGCSGFTYQWEKNGVRIPGQTNSSLVIPSASTNDAGVYSVEVMSICRNLTNSATLSVNQQVVVVTPPASLTNCSGSVATFNVLATGTALTYQWYRGGSALIGRTTSSLSLTNVTALDAGIYGIVVSGACGNAVSNVASLTVTPLPVIACVSNKTVQLGTSWSFDLPTANYPIVIIGTVTNRANHCGNTFDATRTWAAIDACNNSSQCSQTVTVVDTTPPIVNCGNTNKTVELGTAWTFDPPTATDNSGTNITIVIVNTVTNTAGHCGNTFAATRTWAAIDACNNSAQCSQTVTVVDTTPPMINCGNTNKSVVFGTPWTFDPPTATDNSGTNITITIVSTITNTIGYCGNSFDATRTWAAIDACNNSAQCSQKVTVVDTNPIVVITPPSDQTNCIGTIANFSISAQGTGLNYAWLHNGVIVGTNNALALDASALSQAGLYQVIVTDQCGDTVTNSAILVLNETVVTSPLAGAVKNLGDSVTFATTASGTGPFNYLWKKNGSVISGATTSALTLTNLTFADDADYTVEVSGACNRAAQTAHLTINHPPTVEIISPTNGTVFIAPATFTLAATAQDIDGIVTNVSFFLSATNKIGETTNTSPGLLFPTNLAVGSYTYTAQATDDLGARGTSAPVNVSVIAEPPLVIVSSIRLNPQTGLYEQNVRVLNPTYNSVYAIRVTVGNLTNGTVVYNPSGFTNGIAYVQSHTAVLAGAYVDFVIEYYIPSRIIPNPTLHAQLVAPEPGGGTVAFGFPTHVDRGLYLPNNTFLVEFLTISNRIYSIQYSSNLTAWRDVLPPIVGNGTRIQWIDNGQPKTETPPASQLMRFYRVVLLP